LRGAGEADIVANVIDSAAIVASSGSAGLGGAAEWLLRRWTTPRRFLAFILITISVSFAHMTTAAQTNTPTKGTLVIGILTIESSYAQNKERPSRRVPDTLQFWIGADSAWRIRTYATDHDIHPHRVGDIGMMKDRPTELARDHIKKHYGDVLASTVVLEFSDTNDTSAVRKLLTEHKLKGSLEVTKVGFAFWNPDDEHYKSTTAPK
jgi:hypothetical protein